MKQWIEKTEIRKIWISSAIFGIGSVIAFGFIGNLIFQGNPSEEFTKILVIFIGIVCSLPGIAQIIKREMPGGTWGIIKGKPAIIVGWIWIFLCTLISIPVLYDLITNW